MDQRLEGAALTNLLREDATDNGHLTGVPTARGAVALDGNLDTSWITPFDRAVGSTLGASGSGSASTIEITQPPGNFSPITRLRLTDSVGVIDIDVPSGPASVDLLRDFDLAAFSVEIIGIDEAIVRDRRFGEPVVLPSAISELTFDGRSLDIRPQGTLDAQCQTGFAELDGEPMALSFLVDTTDALDGTPFSAQPCDNSFDFDAGRHLLSTTAGAETGFNVDQVAFIEPDVQPASVSPSTIDPQMPVVTDTGRLFRTVEVPPCPAGCWVVLGEGYNTAWSANTPTDDLGTPQLVDGNANGWWIEPTTAPTTVRIEWTVQQPLRIALGASAAAVIALIALVIFDRRRKTDLDPNTWPPTPPKLGGRWPRRAALFTAAAAIVLSTLLIGWEWAIPALLAAGGAVILRRSRVLGVLGLGAVIVPGIVVAYVVRTERPFPGAGFPIRFEWLHGWTLLGILLITCATLWARDARARPNPQFVSAHIDGEAESADTNLGMKTESLGSETD